MTSMIQGFKGGSTRVQGRKYKGSREKVQGFKGKCKCSCKYSR